MKIVYHTNSFYSLDKNMLFCKLRCQNDFDLIIVSYEITGEMFDGVVVAGAPIVTSSLVLEQMWHLQGSQG